MALSSSGLSITSGLEMATTLIKWVLDTISGNEIFAVVLVVGLLVPAGVGIFHSVKNAVR